MIRSLVRTAQGEIKTNLEIEGYRAVLEDPNSFIWVDIISEPNNEITDLMLNTFGFHALAIEDALDQVHVPKIDDWETYLYLVVRAINSAGNVDEQLETKEIDIFLGKNFIVTYHPHTFKSIEQVWDRVQKDDHLFKRGPTHVLYNVIDETATEYMALAETVADEINTIEDQLFDDPQQVMLENIFSLKRDLLHLRRIIAPQREVINKLARDDYGVIDRSAKIYFRDVYDHFSRLYDVLESLRDLTGSALEIYLSVVNNRMNNVMKTLTIITTLFMPISFLVGFFGMNFFQPVDLMDVWTGPLAFRLLMAAVIVFPIGMYLWIRRRGWMQ